MNFEELEAIPRTEFGEWYTTIVDTIAQKVDVTNNTSNKTLQNIESLIKPDLKKVRKQLETATDEDILAQHEELQLINKDKICRIEDYLFPSYKIFGKTDTLKSAGGQIAGAKAYCSLDIPLTTHGERKTYIQHETQHYLFYALMKNGVVPLDLSLGVNNYEDVWMYKNELLSKTVQGQDPVGYTMKSLRGKSKQETEYVKKNQMMLYDSFLTLYNSVIENEIDKKEFIKGTYLARDFEELFYNTLEVAKGGDVYKNDFEKIEFAKKTYEDDFLKYMNIIERPKKDYSKTPIDPFKITSD